MNVNHLLTKVSLGGGNAMEGSTGCPERGRIIRPAADAEDMSSRERSHQPLQGRDTHPAPWSESWRVHRADRSSARKDGFSH